MDLFLSALLPDPDVTFRITSPTIESALVVSPSSERALFSNRAKFELVVMYDASSAHFTPAMSNLTRAIFENDFTQSLKRPPILLLGGLEAWKRDIGEEGVHRSFPPQDNVTKESSPVSNHMPINSHPNAIHGSMPPNSVSIPLIANHANTPPSSNVSMSSDGHERWVPPRPQSQTDLERPPAYSTQTPKK